MWNGRYSIECLMFPWIFSGETRNELSEEEYYEDYDSAENDTSTIDDEDLVISPTTAKISTEKGIKIKQLPVELVLHTTTPKGWKIFPNMITIN